MTTNQFRLRYFLRIVMLYWLAHSSLCGQVQQRYGWRGPSWCYGRQVPRTGQTEQMVVAHLQLVCGCDSCQCLETHESQSGPWPPLSQVPPWSSDGGSVKAWEKEGEDWFPCHCQGQGGGQPQERCRPSHDRGLQDVQALPASKVYWQNHIRVQQMQCRISPCVLRFVPQLMKWLWHFSDIFGTKYVQREHVH